MSRPDKGGSKENRLVPDAKRTETECLIESTIHRREQKSGGPLSGRSRRVLYVLGIMPSSQQKSSSVPRSPVGEYMVNNYICTHGE